MLKILTPLACALISCFAMPVLAQTSVYPYYVRDRAFDDSLKNIIRQAGLDSLFDADEDGMERVSFAVIDLSGSKPVFGGYYADNFIYPASVYKMYVGMEVLRQAGEGKFSLYDQVVVRSPNDVDRSKEISFDPRPLLRAGDTVTIHYLLDLMITRSDNSAANCLIDLAGRPSINRTMAENNWRGSEVTRKFLKRAVEDPGYDTIRSTETCALHAADFMYRLHLKRLVNPYVSLAMRNYLGLQLDTTKLSQGLPKNTVFYHKTGWWSVFTHDVGLVDDGEVRYIIALFTPVREHRARERMKYVSRRVHNLIRNRSRK